jgi:hypothetical protein
MKENKLLLLAFLSFILFNQLYATLLLVMCHRCAKTVLSLSWPNSSAETRREAEMNMMADEKQAEEIHYLHYS